MSAIVSKIENGVIVDKKTSDDAILLGAMDDAVAIGIDGSTTCTGISLITLHGKILQTVAYKRDKGDDSVMYKLKLKSFILKLLNNNSCIHHIFYEEPFLGYASSTVLIELHTLVKEIIYENAPKFDYIKFLEISNQKWKKLFLAPDKIPVGTEAQKAAARRKLEEIYPYFSNMTQDEVDATCMALICAKKIAEGEGDTLESAKKIKPFKFKAQFIAANTDREMLNILSKQIKSYRIPKSLAKDEYPIIELNGRGEFKSKVCEAIGNGDRVIIVKYKSDKYGNATLTYNLGRMALSSKYLYAIVWRQTRKN